MRFPRSSGVLLHPTSLPGRWGIGDLGAAAFQFIEFLVSAGQGLWQVFSLGPTGYGDSPYQCFSAFAGNPLLISLDRLAEAGLLGADELASEAAAAAFPDDCVDYGRVIDFKLRMLRRSFETLQSGLSPTHAAELERFSAAHAGWLDDYALFMAVKGAHNGASWGTWERDIATRQPAALERWGRALARQVAEQKYLQYLFFTQWRSLRQHANRRGIRIIGDVPIFVAYDSADVWANPHLFYLDDDGRPTVVAGVPPDYFSETGQRWGNPLYRWDRMAETGYAWWIHRVRMVLSLVDVLRLDHFRGFESYWEVPAVEETAVNGRWVPGPGTDLFVALERAIGTLPIIAEDLGVITPPVEALRDQFGFPGMKVLQFAFFFTDAHNPYLPHNYLPNGVVYTGTHDNDTTIGWFLSLDQAERERVQRYLDRTGNDIAWDLMRLAFASVADMAIVPMQDVLRLGSDARQNTPGRLGGNWAWRFGPEALTDKLAQELRSLTATYGRLGKGHQVALV